LDHQGSGEPLLLVPLGDSTTFNIATTINGKYQVYLEYWQRKKKKKIEKIDKFVISNVVDILVSGIPGQTDPRIGSVSGSARRARGDSGGCTHGELGRVYEF